MVCLPEVVRTRPGEYIREDGLCGRVSSSDTCAKGDRESHLVTVLFSFKDIQGIVFHCTVMVYLLLCSKLPQS